MSSSSTFEWRRFQRTDKTADFGRRDIYFIGPDEKFADVGIKLRDVDGEISSRELLEVKTRTLTDDGESWSKVIKNKGDWRETTTILPTVAKILKNTFLSTTPTTVLVSVEKDVHKTPYRGYEVEESTIRITNLSTGETSMWKTESVEAYSASDIQECLKTHFSGATVSENTGYPAFLSSLLAKGTMGTVKSTSPVTKKPYVPKKPAVKKSVTVPVVKNSPAPLPKFVYKDAKTDAYARMLAQ
ncbi:MAG: hypothetical protein PHG66_00710 [Candidatus Colwellbacteria bacterium]|nr:hypothetical protein [Candidatus Colwellbacteria bacterium]